MYEQEVFCWQNHQVKKGGKEMKKEYIYGLVSYNILHFCFGVLIHFVNLLEQPFSTRVQWNPRVPEEVARGSLSYGRLTSHLLCLHSFRYNTIWQSKQHDTN